MHRMTVQHNAERIVAGAAACITALVTTASPLVAQEVVELPAEDRILSANFEELYRIGSLMGGEWDTFGQIVDLDFDGAGNLYVLDGQAAKITVVDPEGNLVRQFGRVGEGPGEFSGVRDVWALTVCSNQNVVVYDAGRRVFVLFGSDGEFERGIRLEGPRFVSIPGLQCEAQSRSVVSTGEVQYLDWTQLTEPSFQYVMRYGLSGDNAVVDTVATGWKPPGGGFDFVPMFSVGALPDGGVAFIDSTTYAIEVTGPDGGSTRILTRPTRPAPLTGRLKAEYVEQQLKEIQRLVGPAADFRRTQLESIERFHEIPRIRDLRTSRDGTIWVRRGGDELGIDGPIDLITVDGRYLGSFTTGSTAMPSAFGPNGLVAFVETDDLDVSCVVVKRLPDGMR